MMIIEPENPENKFNIPFKDDLADMTSEDIEFEINAIQEVINSETAWVEALVAEQARRALIISKSVDVKKD